MKPSSHLGALLRLVAEFVSRLSEQEVEALIAGTAQLQISGQAGPRRVPARTKGARRDHLDVVAALRGARTREEARATLEGGGMSKLVLEKIARELDLPVLRSDNVGRLRQKIVEAVVGYRINSEAIQGRPPEPEQQG